MSNSARLDDYPIYLITAYVYPATECTGPLDSVSVASTQHSTLFRTSCVCAAAVHSAVTRDGDLVGPSCGDDLVRHA